MALAPPLEIELRLPEWGNGGVLKINGEDFSHYTRSVSLSSGVDDVTEITVTLQRIRINQVENS